jgi:hypothetical protein
VRGAYAAWPFLVITTPIIAWKVRPENRRDRPQQGTAVIMTARGELGVAVGRLPAEVDGLLLEFGDLLVELPNVGGTAQAGFIPDLLAEGFR